MIASIVPYIARATKSVVCGGACVECYVYPIGHKIVNSDCAM